MPEPTLRELLNRLRWHRDIEPAAVELVVWSRESGQATEQVVSFSAVTEILAAGVLLANGTFLPYHRVAAVRAGQDQLWCARQRSWHGRA